jgi:hypothetical protein
MGSLGAGQSTRQDGPIGPRGGLCLSFVNTTCILGSFGAPNPAILGRIGFAQRRQPGLGSLGAGPAD